MKIFAVLTFCLFVQGIYGQSADFSFQSPAGSYCAPVPVQFTSSFTESPVGYVWDFGDGSNSNAASPVHTFAGAGTFSVTLILIFRQSTASVTKNIVIHPANNVGLNAGRNFICTPGGITFTAAGGPQVSYLWDYGDGSTETTPTGNVSHTFNNFQDYNVTVKATNNDGCEAVATVAVALKKPDITGSFSPSGGCIPATAAFTASVTIPSGSSVSAYLWDFGDGNTSNTSVDHVTHVYSSRGAYLPKVSITTSEGCTADFNFGNAAYGVPPANIHAYAQEDTICASDNAMLVANALNANQYTWQFGDGTSSSLSDTIIAHKYNILGVQNVTVTPYDNGCQGAAASLPVDIIGVLASYNYTINCSQRDHVLFTDQSIGAVTSFLWDYGDGQQNDSVASPLHIYPPSGSFNTVLTVTDSVSGCSDHFQASIHTATPTLTNPDSSLCRNAFTVFNVDNSYSNAASLYTYHILGTVTAPVSYNYMSIRPQNFGTFNNYVVIDNGPHYCQDTVLLDHQILVKGPDLNFQIDSAICLNDSFHIQNQSQPYLAGDSIVSWEWLIANGDTLTTGQPAPFKFRNAGNNSVQLVAKDINGCVDTLTKTVVVNGLPFLLVIPESDTLCAGVADTLIAFHNVPITWTSSQPIACNTCDTIVVAPAASADYMVRATSAAGCFSSDTIPLKVYPKFSARALDPLSYICPGDTVSLHVSPQGMEIQWSPSTSLSDPAAYDPVASPATTTQYVAYLTDSAGCFSDSVAFRVNVNSPAIVDAGADTTVSYNAPFSLSPVYSNNIVTYEWSPPGDLSCVFCADPDGTAKDSYTYVIKATTDSGCISYDSVDVFITCDQASLLMPNAFTPNDDQLNDVFYPIGRGISHIKRFAVYDRWGNVVFSKNDFLANDRSSGWDGRIHGEPASPGVFIYIVEALCAKGETLFKKGTVTLIK